MLRLRGSGESLAPGMLDGAESVADGVLMKDGSSATREDAEMPPVAQTPSVAPLLADPFEVSVWQACQAMLITMCVPACTDMAWVDGCTAGKRVCRGSRRICVRGNAQRNLEQRCLASLP